MPAPTAIDPISASLRLIIERMHKHVGDRLYDLRSEAEAILPIACIEATTPAKPAKLLAIIAWAVLGLSDGDRRMVELHLAVARLSPERRGRLLDRFDGSVDALADDLQAYMQGADVSVGSPEDGGDEARLEVTWDRETQRLCLVEVDHGGETMGETTSFAQVRAADLPMRLSELLAAHSADFDRE